jgi:pyruvate carboxylase
MRVVRTEDEFARTSTPRAARRAAAFGNDEVFIEKLIERPKHIEVQILADGFGNVVHLYERDCSVQRRHQKVVEIAPAPNLPEEAARQGLFDAAPLARASATATPARSSSWSPARHYFIEVNPRLQVEHTVTEEITGVDLVQAQIRVAGLPDLSPSSASAAGGRCSRAAARSSAASRPRTRRTTSCPTPVTIVAYRSPGGFGCASTAARPRRRGGQRPLRLAARESITFAAQSLAQASHRRACARSASSASAA